MNPLCHFVCLDSFVASGLTHSMDSMLLQHYNTYQGAIYLFLAYLLLLVKYLSLLGFFCYLRSCQLLVSLVLKITYDIKHLGQVACRVEDFLSMSWISDPDVSEILVLHHVTSLHVHKHRRDTQINTFTHRHTQRRSHQTYVHANNHIHTST